jgi:hypothetical protein
VLPRPPAALIILIRLCLSDKRWTTVELTTPTRTRNHIELCISRTCLPTRGDPIEQRPPGTGSISHPAATVAEIARWCRSIFYPSPVADETDGHPHPMCTRTSAGQCRSGKNPMLSFTFTTMFSCRFHPIISCMNLIRIWCCPKQQISDNLRQLYLSIICRRISRCYLANLSTVARPSLCQRPALFHPNELVGHRS